MNEQFNYFWWDGGFESIHNRPKPEVNPYETAHILTPFYRFDISRMLALPTGFEIIRNKAEEYKYGLVLPPPEIIIEADIIVIIDEKEYFLKKQPHKGKSLMVYDSGTVCHQLRLKGVSLYDKSGVPLAGIELEMALYLWNNLISVSIHLLDASTRLHIKGKAIKMHMGFELSGCEVSPYKSGAYLKEKNGGFYVSAASDTQLYSKTGCINSYCDSSVLCLHILPYSSDKEIDAYHEVVNGNINVNAYDMTSGNILASRYDPVSGGIAIKLDDLKGKGEDKIRIAASTESDLNIPLRMLALREGKGRIMEDGTILPMEAVGSFAPMGVFPMAFKPDGMPSGGLWQVSIDGHEFENYPKPYTHKWIHLYRSAVCSKLNPMDETLHIGSPSLAGGPSAAFCQLSLLGWDDNPHYGNPLDKTAVQLWIQGLINHQEILCICPESHMTDCTITDIRPIDHRNKWGPNNGGGDFLRYRLPGSRYMNKMCAARCHFPNYGPLLGTVEYYLTSEDDAISGYVKAHIVASDDIARVFFEAEYEVLKDIEAEELVLAWLGCPGYDKSRYARYAWGIRETAVKDSLVEIQTGPGEELIDKVLVGGEWFAAYRGGIIDEQFREPNANKGMIYHGGSIKLQAHPEAQIKAKRLRIDVFDGLTSQFWIGIYPQNYNLRLKRGDSIKVSWEYVPVLKYATDYGLGGSNSEVYREILMNYPDSYQMIQYEAKHGYWNMEVIRGQAVENTIFPGLYLENQEGEFELEGGSGWTPIRVYLRDVPGQLKLFEVIGNKHVKIVHPLKYQIEAFGDQWIATFMVRGGAETVESTRMKRKFVVKQIC